MKVLYREDFQHEKDGRLLKNILENSALDIIMDFMRKNYIEDIYMYVFRSSYLPLTQNSSPKVYRLAENACKLLGLKKLPEIYLVRDYDRMIYLGGLSSPFLVLSTELLRIADDQLLFGLIASQIAGIQVEHHRALFIEWVISVAGSQLPGAVVTAISAVINDWKRCCYFTYDRVFYLATRNAELALAQILFPTIQNASRFRLGSEDSTFLAQVSYFYGDSVGSGVLKMLHSLSNDQPWMPERYVELKSYLKEVGVL